jgi:hypothetical protein
MWCAAQDTGALLHRWSSRKGSVVGWVLALASSQMLNHRFKQVGARLREAFAMLSQVMGISSRQGSNSVQTWLSEEDVQAALQAALRADLQAVVAEVQQQGAAAQAELKVRAPALGWGGTHEHAH